MIRTANFPALLLIALYERQSKKHGTTGFYETIIVAIENLYDALPRPLKRLCESIVLFTSSHGSLSLLAIFEGLAGSGGDIAAVSH